jgi:hypothetical protein
MVKMSCQLLFIDFFGPFCHFFEPFCCFFWLENHLMWFLSFLLDVTMHFSFGLVTFLGGDGSFLKGPLVKVIFPTFCI